MVACDKIKTLYIYFRKTYKDQTWYICNLGLGAPKYSSSMFLWSYGHVMSPEKNTVIFSLLKSLKYQTWHNGHLGWKAQIHVALDQMDAWFQIANKKRSI